MMMINGGIMIVGHRQWSWYANIILVTRWLIDSGRARRRRPPGAAARPPLTEWPRLRGLGSAWQSPTAGGRFRTVTGCVPLGSGPLRGRAVPAAVTVTVRTQ